MSKDAKERFLEKHPPLTEKQIKDSFRKSAQAKDQYESDMAKVEKNLLGYLEIIEPLVDPETDMVLAWMKLPTNELLINFYSSSEKPTKVTEMSKEQKVERVNKDYELMAELCLPKHNADWWKKHTNPKITSLFSLKLEQLFEDMGGLVENFPEATEDSR